MIEELEMTTALGFAAMETAQWNYFTVTNEDGSPRLVVRRNGPDIQLLTANGWVDRPQLLTRFQDAGFLEQTDLAGAQRSATSIGGGLQWPREDLAVG